MSGCPDCAERPRRWWLWVAVAICAPVALAQLVGCGGRHRVVHIGPLEPSPKIQLAHQPTPVVLEVSQSTPDGLRVETDGFATVEIIALRATLQTAFDRG